MNQALALFGKLVRKLSKRLHDIHKAAIEATIPEAPSARAAGSGDADAAGENAARHGTNTLVAHEDAHEEPEAQSPASEHHEDSGSETAASSSHGSEEHERKGVVGRLKEWKDHEKELARDHRGVMQTKPVRTAEWIKDNIEDGAHAVKSRFSMKARQPDVETEV